MKSADILLEKYKKANRVVSLMDSRFDYDTLCANIVLKEVSDSFGVKHDIFFEGTLPSFAEILISKDKLEQINQNTNLDVVYFSFYDLLFLIDSSTFKHVKSTLDFEIPKDTTVVNIDHHKTNNYYGDINIVDKNLTAACSVLYTLLKEIGYVLTKDQAQMLLLGIYTDSGFFQFDTVSSEDMFIAGELMDLGASLYDIAWHFTFNESYEDMKLKALVYSNLVVNFENKYAYSVIGSKDLKKHEVNLDNTNLAPADLIKQLEEVDFVFVIKELGDNHYNISLRSHKKDFEVLPIAEHFGGGGHTMAAGCNIETKTNNPVDEIIEKILKTLN